MASCYDIVQFYGCTNSTGTTCTKTGLYYAFQNNSATPTSCPGVVVLSAGEYNSYQALSLTMGWDQPAFEIAFGGGLLLFAVGLGIGLIVSAVRRARTI